MERSAKRGERIGGHNVVAMRLERVWRVDCASYVIEWLSLKFCQF